MRKEYHIASPMYSSRCKQIVNQKMALTVVPSLCLLSIFRHPPWISATFTQSASQVRIRLLFGFVICPPYRMHL